MDFVAARRQLDAELRGDDAAAAVGGVAGDADLAFGCHRCIWALNPLRPLDATGFTMIHVVDDRGSDAARLMRLNAPVSGFCVDRTASTISGGHTVWVP